MKQAYIKPVLFHGKEPAGLIPLVAGIAAAMGVSQAVAGLVLGAAATSAAVSGGVALAKKAGQNYCRLERLPALDGVEVYA
ncbi:MAG: hypothetical protein LBD93_10985 [Treponema sp.]|jgi:hypothetical protein|nr:hypothetical protein [Treponema sp.]